MAALLGSAAIAAEKHLLATTFQQFSDNLYCSGSEERLCGTGGPRTGPGECLWFAGTRPVKPAEMDPADNGARAAWPRHRRLAMVSPADLAAAMAMLLRPRCQVR